MKPRMSAAALLVCSLHAAPVLPDPDRPFGILTETSFVIPANINELAPEPGDGWSNSLSETFDRSYLFTVTGGTGEGLLKFRAYANSGVFFQPAGAENVRRYAQFTDPFFLTTPGAIPQGSVSQSCGESAFQDQCSVEFTFG